jgi:hypothetical protein
MKEGSRALVQHGVSGDAEFAAAVGELMAVSAKKEAWRRQASLR